MGKLQLANITLFGPRRYREQARVVTLPTGERVQITVDDSGTVTHIEHNHTLDAIVRPKTVTAVARTRKG